MSSSNTNKYTVGDSTKGNRRYIRLNRSSTIPVAAATNVPIVYNSIQVNHGFTVGAGAAFDLNTTNGQFTSPFDGYVDIDISNCGGSDVTLGTQIIVQKNGSDVKSQVSVPTSAAVQHRTGFSLSLEVVRGDVIGFIGRNNDGSTGLVVVNAAQNVLTIARRTS